mgnify:CR=1 FL=1
MAKAKVSFFCQQCGYESPKWMGKCPGCSAWNTMVEELRSPASKGVSFSANLTEKKPVQPIRRIEGGDEPRWKTDLDEFNRVLGGGIVHGSLILVGGDPGIGKSTLLLQVSDSIARQHKKVLYVSGEESPVQTRMRAERLGTLSDDLFLLCETNLEWIGEALETLEPDLLIIDSIQTVYHPQVTSAPGSVAQVRECTGMLMRWAKTKGIATIVVGHVTKEGAIAGPRMLEHMVDCVLYFEGEPHHTYRMLRSVKNRFGSTNEIGMFEMSDAGLKEVTNPSELFLSERPTGASGSAVTASMEGTRPLLLEMQALVAPTHFPSPRRMATGYDYNRLSMIMAVLEKRMGIALQHHDAYLNVAGGVKLVEPAVDLAVAVSIVSSFRDCPTDPNDVFIGEIGLTGEVRAVSKVEWRVREAHKLGFKRVFLPASGMKGWQPSFEMELVYVRTVADALEAALRR